MSYRINGLAQLVALPMDHSMPAPPDSSAQASPRRLWWPELALLATAVAYALSQLQLWKVRLGWDETVYFSQVSRTVPAAYFSAPRARGISWLAEPLALTTSSSSALRVYLTVLSGLALYLAFRTWLKVLPPGAVICSAGLFASLWITRFYGAELMPNLWVAFGVVAAVGGWLRLAADRTDRVGLLMLLIGLAGAAAMRPSDGVWATAPLLVITVARPPWRTNWRLLLGTVAGPVLGAVPWVVEAYRRFGGVPGRLNRSSQIEGGLGWHPGILPQHWW